MYIIIIVILIIIIVSLLLVSKSNQEKNSPLSRELQKEIKDFMSEIENYDIEDIEKPKKEPIIKEEKSKQITEDTLDLNDLFKTMSISIVKDKSDFDFGLVNNNHQSTKK